MPSRTELFLDDAMLDMTAGVSRRIHQPRKHRLNPVMVPEKWWEGDCIMPLATLYDPGEKRFHMWYRTGYILQPEKAIEGHVSYTAYATSTDGVHWERPPVGALDLAGRRDHSVVLTGGVSANLGRQGKKGFILSVIRHPRPRDEGEKFVCMFADMTRRGCYLGYSADGIHWRREPEPFWRTPVDPTGWGDDTVKSMIYDRLRDRWIVYRRVTPQESERLVARPGDENWRQPDRVMRIMGFAESPDLKSWFNHRVIMVPDGDDPADVEFYGLTCHVYEQVYLGYLWVFHMRPGVENIDIQLVSSRNGTDFTRCCRRETFLPAGPRDSYDYELTLGYQAEPILVNDEVYLYYEACNYAHEYEDYQRPYSRITGGLATFPRDRFVSLQTGPPEPCRVVTRPFAPEFPRLFLNAAVWGDGEIRVEAVTRDWQPIPGFAADDAMAVRGNALAHPVRWKEHADMGPLVGREIRLKFYMRCARLHAMIQDTADRPLGWLPDLRAYEAETATGPKDV